MNPAVIYNLKFFGVFMHLSEIKDIHVAQLLEMAAGYNIENASRLRKHDLIFAILRKVAEQGENISGGGVLEVLPDGFGFLRSPIGAIKQLQLSVLKSSYKY